MRIVLVEPEGEVNVGSCARVLANFGLDDLWIVRPKCAIGKVARMYAKRAWPLLKRAKVVRSLKLATRGHLVVGTTAIKKTHSDVLRTAISPEELVPIAKAQPIAILFGREGTGLTKEELALCDVIVRIPTSAGYPAMNISHALAVVVYVLSREKFSEAAPEIKERHVLIKKFDEALSAVPARLRNPTAIRLVWRRTLARGLRSPLEARALLQALKVMRPSSS